MGRNISDIIKSESYQKRIEFIRDYAFGYEISMMENLLENVTTGDNFYLLDYLMMAVVCRIEHKDQ